MYMFIYKNTIVNPVLSGHSKRRTEIGFQYRLSLNAGQKFCRFCNTFNLHYATICHYHLCFIYF